MEIDCLLEESRWGALDLQAIADAALDQIIAAGYLGNDEWELSILACDDARIAELNGDFRDKPKPTNVLSWPSEERAAQTAGGTPLAPSFPELGDIAIAYETCEREAAEQGKPMGEHVTHLILHGMLHLLGYDHETDADAALMEGIEIRLLAKMGLDNPYLQDTA